MLRVPATVFRQEISIEDYQGSTAYGPKFGAPRAVRCRIEGRRRRVVRANGVELVSSATALVPHDEVIPLESRVTWQARSYEVVDVLPQVGATGRVSHFEVLLS